MSSEASPQLDSMNLATAVPWWHPRILNLDSTLGCVPYHKVGLDLSSATHEAIAQFEADFTLPGILMKTGEQFIGLLSRPRFYEIMSRPFSLELFTNRPLKALWKVVSHETLVLEADLAITVATRQALQRKAKNIYEPIVVSYARQQYGVVDIHTLLLAQSTIHELALEELKISKKALSEEKDLAKITLKSIADGVISTNSLGKIQEINPVAETLTGFSRSRAIGCVISSIFQPVEATTKSPLANPVQTALETQSAVYSEKNVLLSSKGDWRYIQYSASPIFDHQNQLLGAILVFRDVSQQQVLLHRIYWQASHDSLTGLMNRVEFENNLTAEICNARKSKDQRNQVLIYLDLDRFKTVNDTCGHFAGDELLRQVGSLLKKCLRDQDLLARLGGDEFGILLRECDLVKGQTIADCIYQAIQGFRFIWQDHTFTIGASIGVTVIDGHLSTVEALKQADSACYLAKHQGRNKICFYENSAQKSAHDQSVKLLTRLNQALKYSQFSLFYQKIYSTYQAEKKIDIAASKILVRLSNPQGGWIFPETFLQTAERYNLMADIDRWVLETFCQYYPEIRLQTGCDRFSINLSNDSLNSDRFLNSIEEQLNVYDISPENICFEITESVAIKNLTRVQSLFWELKKMGHRLAIDEFEGGLPAFRHLRSLPIDYLKIDGKLVDEIVTDRVVQEMVATIIKISHEMGMKTVAESVANEKVIEILSTCNNDYLQGDLLHEPEILNLH
jgi:diguanylate cyclase (GGDEF)-like protein/PAS domain S-box-containing protein